MKKKLRINQRQLRSSLLCNKRKRSASKTAEGNASETTKRSTGKTTEGNTSEATKGSTGETAKRGAKKNSQFKKKNQLKNRQ